MIRQLLTLVFSFFCISGGAAAFAQDLEASYQAAKKAMMQGKVAESIKLYEQTIKLADQKNDPQKRVLARLTLATQYDSAGKFLLAETLFADTLKVAAATSFPATGIARIYQMQVRHYVLQNKFAPAKVALAKCIELGGKRDQDKDYGDFLALAASVYEGSGDYAKALTYYDKSEKWLDSTPDDKEKARSISSCITNKAVCLTNTGRFDEAQASLTRALEIGEKAFGKEFEGLCATHHALANLYLKKKQPKLALQEFDTTLAMMAKNGVSSGALVERIKRNRDIATKDLAK